MWELDVGDEHRRRDVLTVLSLFTLFAVLVGVTVAGIVINWPHGRASAGPFRQPKTYEAHVLALRSVPCEASGAQHCSLATVRLAGGPDQGTSTTIRFGDTGTNLRLALGDTIRVYKNALPANARLGGVKVPRYAFSDFERRGPLLWLVGAFAAIVLLAGRFSGLRALAGLVASLGMVVFFIVPAITDGKPPLQVAAFGAFGVMLLTIPLVHGVGAKSLAACLGTGLALLLTLALADLFTSLAHLSGLTSDQVIYLQAESHVSVRGLVLAGMVIGSLGVLGDTTVTQASTVIALHRVDPSLGWRELATHATSVGRDHIAATVNTLVLAYAGAALPILVVFGLAGTSFGSAVNTESVATPIIATLVGSIGLIAAVPITTALAALLALRLGDRQLGDAHVHR